MIDNNSWYTVCGWMINELDLKGTELVVYARIYSYTHGEKNQSFYGSAKHLAEWANSTTRSVQSAIKSLSERGLLRITKVNATHNTYNVIVPDNCKIPNSKKTYEKNSQGITKNFHNTYEKNSQGITKKFHNNYEKISYKNNKNTYKNTYKIDSKKNPDYLPDTKIIPSLEEVQAYAAEMDLKINPVKFYEYYQAKKWIKKNGEPVKSWKLTMCRWSDNEIDPKEKAAEANSKTSFQQNEYDFEALERELRAN